MVMAVIKTNNKRAGFKIIIYPIKKQKIAHCLAVRISERWQAVVRTVITGSWLS
jgi:hypothetical protein